MLMPLAFAAHAGSQLALTGTPINIIVSDAAREAGERGFGFFEFSLVGIPLLAQEILVAQRARVRGQVRRQALGRAVREQ